MTLTKQRLFARLYRAPEPEDTGGGGGESFADLAGEVMESDDGGGDDEPGEGADDNPAAGADDGDDLGDGPLELEGDTKRPARGTEDGDDAPAAADEDDAEVSWTAGDKPVKAKMSELRAAYQAKADYDARMPEMTERETQATTLATQAQQQLAQGGAIVQNLLTFMQAELEASKPDIAMLRTDPTTYLELNEAWNQRVQKYQQALQAQGVLQQAQPAVNAEARKTYLLQQQAKLYEAKPEWRNPAVRAAELGKVAKALSAVGYSVEEIRGMTDYRALVISSDAYKWRELQALKANKTAPKAKPTQTVKPGVAAPSNAPKNQSVVKIATARLNRNPNDAKALEGLIGAVG